MMEDEFIRIDGINKDKNHYEKLICVIEDTAIVHKVNPDTSQENYMSYPELEL